MRARVNLSSVIFLRASSRCITFVAKVVTKHLFVSSKSALKKIRRHVKDKRSQIKRQWHCVCVCVVVAMPSLAR